MQSTQRAESIHSAIKNHTRASALLTQLGEILVNYADGCDIRNEAKKARDILVASARSFATDSGHMAAVQSLEGKISTFAMHIIKSQQAQAMAYHVEEGPALQNGLVKTFTVRRENNLVMESTLANPIQADHGLVFGANQSLRLVTPFSCTCQFHSCWGLPCRHMLRVYLQMQSSSIPECVVKPRWMTHDAKYISEKKRELLRTLPASAGMQSTNVKQKMTRAERFAYLLHECKAMAETAAVTEEAMDVLVRHLDLARDEISKLQLPSDLEPHSFNPTLFPSLVFNPGLPTAKGRPQTKRIESSGNCGKKQRLN